MPASVSIVGLSSAFPLPGVFPEVNFAQGQASGASLIYGALMICNKTTAGTGTADTVIYGPDTITPMQSQADADALGGVGSECSLGFRRFTAVNKTTPLYVIFVTESVGAFATATITLTTTATSAGTLRIYRAINDFVDVPINAGDTPTVVATAAAAASTGIINGRTDWPFTATNTAGVITLTAKQKGLRGNWLRYWSRIFPSCGMTTSTTTPAFFTGGTTADSSTAALATILSKRFYFLISAAEDATQVGALVSQVNTQALATNNLRQEIFYGSVDTLANATTIATGQNAARAGMTWLAQSDWTPFELACNQAAIESLEMSASIPRLNFDNYGADAVSATNWKVPAPMSGVGPTIAQQVSALNNGISPIAVTPRATTYLVSSITNRSLNGASPDYRVRDKCKVFVCDLYADDLVAKIGTFMPGKQIADDPIGNAPAPGGNTVTPRIVKAATNKLSQDYFDRGLFQNIAAIQAGTIAIRESSPTTRMSVQVPAQVSDVWHQTGVQINQVA